MIMARSRENIGAPGRVVAPFADVVRWIITLFYRAQEKTPQPLS